LHKNSRQQASIAWNQRLTVSKKCDNKAKQRLTRHDAWTYPTRTAPLLNKLCFLVGFSSMAKSNEVGLMPNLFAKNSSSKILSNLVEPYKLTYFPQPDYRHTKRTRFIFFRRRSTSNQKSNNHSEITSSIECCSNFVVINFAEWAKTNATIFQTL
jgi:hypothetical protein